MQRRLVGILGIFALVTVAACGGGAPSEEGARETPAAAPVDEATAGTLTGRVVLTGTPPPAEQIRMAADPICLKEATDTRTEFFGVGADGGLANVFVYVKEGLGDRTFPAPSETVVVDQQGCRYRPHVFGVQVGQPIQILNSDPTLHNVHATPSNNVEFNTSQPKQGMKFEATFSRPEVMVPLKCDVHPWMNAYVGVLEHPYFATTTANGRFDIRTLPPGTYVIEAWHEKLGKQTQEITIGEKETKEIVFTFSVT